MKKILNILLVFSLILTLTACGNKTQKETKKEETTVKQEIDESYRQTYFEEVKKVLADDVKAKELFAYYLQNDDTCTYNKGKGWDNLKYAFEDINNDQIKELFILFEGNESCAKIALYQIKDKKIDSAGELKANTKIYNSKKGYFIETEKTLNKLNIKNNKLETKEIKTESNAEYIQKNKAKEIEFKELTEFYSNEVEEYIEFNNKFLAGTFNDFTTFNESLYFQLNEDGTWKKSSSYCDIHESGEPFLTYEGTYEIGTSDGKNVVKFKSKDEEIPDFELEIIDSLELKYTKELTGDTGSLGNLLVGCSNLEKRYVKNYVITDEEIKKFYN